VVVQIRKTQFLILGSDALCLIVATALAFVFRFGEETTSIATVVGPIQFVGSLIPIFWLTILIILGAYDHRVLFLGLSEFSRLVQSGIIVLAVISTFSFLLKFDTSRAYVLVTIPMGLISLAATRYLWRRKVLRDRGKGVGLAPTVICGTTFDSTELALAMKERPWAGYRVVAQIPGPPENLNNVDEVGVWIGRVVETLESEKAQALALAGSAGSHGDLVREISWRIEGKDIDLLVEAGLGRTSGPRVTLRVASGLPLLHLDEVALRHTQRFAKRSLDIVGSFFGLLVISPILAVVGLVVLLSSGWPIYFRQKRLGRGGEIFSMWKFRTMVKNADSLKEDLRQQSENPDSPTFKLEGDPRITKVGGFLRRWSLDELPQLFNVLSGEMSLVGPRPHPLDDAERYQESDSRRLIAKPGMTGLWQVAGRSDLSWDQSLELDLIYIENWTFIGDLAILARTFKAVIEGRGAK